MHLPRPARLALLAVAVPSLVLSLSGPAQAHVRQSGLVTASGTFGATAPAFTYDTALVPPGATARVAAWYLPSGHTVVVLRVRGLVPNREYGAHAHTTACGATGTVAGPHFQYAPDPVTPSTNAAYANADNEIWLDFTTDAYGRGWAIAIQDWQPPADRRPASVVLHLEHTHDGTDGAVPGTAGARLACLSVGF